MTETLLSPEEVFAAMYRFLEAYYARSGGSGELASVLSDLQLLPADAFPADPAMREDWLAAIKEAKAGQSSNTSGPADTPGSGELGAELQATGG